MKQSMSLRKTPHVSQVVRAARNAQGLTQSELAARARVSQRWLSLFENGHTPGAELHKVLGVLATLGVEITATIASDEGDKDGS